MHCSVLQIGPPICNLSLSTKCRGGLYVGCEISSLDQKMLSGSVDAGFILVLPFHYGDLEPDCVGVSAKGGEAYVRDENTIARLCAKNAGGRLCMGGLAVQNSHAACDK